MINAYRALTHLARAKANTPSRFTPPETPLAVS